MNTLTHTQAPSDLRRRFPHKKICAAIVKVYGWMGKEEAIHPVCVLSTFDLSELRKTDSLFGSLELKADVNCAYSDGRQSEIEQKRNT
jgi:hypothetical protein